VFNEPHPPYPLGQILASQAPAGVGTLHRSRKAMIRTMAVQPARFVAMKQKQVMDNAVKNGFIQHIEGADTFR
jgi:hypothetical protein